MLKRLKHLEGLRLAYGVDAAAQKRAVLDGLRRCRFGSAAALLRYHEILCWMAAYPDDAPLLAAVNAELGRFAQRSDLRRFGPAFVNSGVAGSVAYCNFFWMMARWLVPQFGPGVKLDWDGTSFEPRLRAALPLLLPWSQAEAVRRSKLPLRILLDRLRGGGTDAAFVVGAIGQMPGDEFAREQYHDAIDPSYALAPAPGVPSRTLACHPPAPLVFRNTPPSAARPDLLRELRRKPLRVTPVPAPEARALVDLARGAMLTRARDLVAFSWGDARDVVMVDDGDGLAFAMIGSLPERRLPLPAVHGLLMLRNRVPVGYVQLDCLLGGAEVAFNLFDTFRGGEAAYLFARVLALAHHVLGAQAFSIEPYQLGEGNDEGIASGAWWFYYKMGFRPIAPEPKRVLAQELARIGRRPSHRSDAATLAQLATGHMVFEPTPDVRAWLPWMPGLGLAAKLLPEPEAAALALRRLSLAGLRGWSVPERQAWQRFAPVLAALGGVEQWSAQQRSAAAAVVRAKGGRREALYLARMRAHAPLSGALVRLLQTSKRSKT